MTAGIENDPETAVRITELLRRFSSGDRQAGEALFAAVLSELKRIAIVRLARERDNFPLQPTELVNMAYLKLADRREKVWADRRHFFNCSAKIMQNLLVDLARHEDALKGPGKWVAIPLEDDLTYTDYSPDQFLDLARGVERLRAADERAATILEHRFYGGLSNAEIAEEMGVCTRTVVRELEFARAWLKRELHGSKP